MNNSRIAVYECKNKSEMLLVSTLLAKLGISVKSWGNAEAFTDYCWLYNYRFVGADRNNINAWLPSTDFYGKVVVNTIGDLINFYLKSQKIIKVDMGRGLEFEVTSTTITWQGRVFDATNVIADLRQAQKDAENTP